MRPFRPALLAALVVLLTAGSARTLPPDGCDIPGFDDRCEAWTAVYDEVGPRGWDTWLNRPLVRAAGDRVFAAASYRLPGPFGLDPIATVAYDADTGAQLWARRYGEPGEAFLHAMEATPGGGLVLVAGSHWSGDRDVPGSGLLLAYDGATGERRWLADLLGVAGSLTAIALSPDGGRVYAAGTAASEAGADIVVAGFDTSSGSLLWSRRYDGPAGVDDYPSAIATDGSRVFVAGTRDRLYQPQVREEGDFVALAYSDEGALLWESSYAGTPGHRDTPRDAALSPDGSTFFVTGTQDNNGSGSGENLTDIATVAFAAADGSTLWSAVHDGPAGRWDSAAALATDGSRVYVAGTVVVQAQDTPEGPVDWDHDAVLLAYDAAGGTKAWEARAGRPGHLAEGASDVTVSGDHVYTTGMAAVDWVGFIGFGPLTELPLDYATLAYRASDGVQEWSARFNNASGVGSSRPGSLAVAPDGSTLFVAGFLSAPVTPPAPEDESHARLGTLAYSLG